MHLQLLESDLLLQVKLMLGQLISGQAQFHSESDKFSWIRATKELLNTAINREGYVMMFSNSAVMYFNTLQDMQGYLSPNRVGEVLFYAKIVDFQKREMADVAKKFEQLEGSS